MHPQPLFYLFGNKNLGIYPYGLCMAIGIIACFAFLFFTMWKNKYSEASSDAVLLIGVFGTGFGIFAAMLFQSVYNYIANPSAGFHLGGMTFIGGLIGGVLSFVGVWNLYVFVVRPRTNIGFLKKEMNAGLCDALPFIPIGITIAHAFGRLGCFFAGCCYGKPTDAWYGLYCARTFNEYTGTVYMGDKVIPTQLFEMAFLIILGVAMAILYFRFRFNYNFAVYAIAYGVWRFLLEFIRDDARGEFIGAVTPSQFWSIIMVIAGIGYIFIQKYLFVKFMKHPELAVAAAENGEQSETVTAAGELAVQPDETEEESGAEEASLKAAQPEPDEREE